MGNELPHYWVMERARKRFEERLCVWQASLADAEAQGASLQTELVDAGNCCEALQRDASEAAAELRYGLMQLDKVSQGSAELLSASRATSSERDGSAVVASRLETELQNTQEELLCFQAESLVAKRFGLNGSPHLFPDPLSTANVSVSAGASVEARPMN